MYKMISSAAEMLYIVLQGCCLQYFAGSFLECRLSERRTAGAAVILYMLLQSGADMLLPSGGFAAFPVKQAVTACVLPGLIWCLYKADGGMNLFLTVTFTAVREISLFLGYMVMQPAGRLMELWIRQMEKTAFSPAEAVRAVEITALAAELLMKTAVIGLLYLSLRKLKKNFREKDRVIRGTEALFLLTPGMSGVLICTLLRIIMVTTEDGRPKLLYDRYPVLIAVVPAILLLALLSVQSGVKLFQELISLNRERNGRVILERQIEGLQKHIREMEYAYSGMRSMKHDMKNTLSVIMRLAAPDEKECCGGEEKEALRAYLAELDKALKRQDFRFRTGNAVADALLTVKCHEAEETLPGLRLDAEELIFSPDMGIQGYDIGVILGNALDNALEACVKLREREEQAEIFIRASSRKKGRMLFINVENSFDGRLILKPEAEFPATDKEDAAVHGIGLKGIRNTAEKYCGAVEWEASGRTFMLSVMMQEARGRM